MAFANVFIKTSRDRWRGWVISAASLTALLLFGMSVYRDIDLSVYTQLPEVWRSLLGIGDDVDVGGLAIGYIFGSTGALVVAAMALVMGSASIAGEERNGTMGILLVNPRSRYARPAVEGCFPGAAHGCHCNSVVGANPSNCRPVGCEDWRSAR